MLPRIIASSPCRFELNPFKIRNTEKRIFETVSLLIGQTDSSDCTIHVVNKRRASSIYSSYNLGYFFQCFPNKPQCFQLCRIVTIHAFFIGTNECTQIPSISFLITDSIIFSKLSPLLTASYPVTTRIILRACWIHYSNTCRIIHRDHHEIKYSQELTVGIK